MPLLDTGELSITSWHAGMDTTSNSLPTIDIPKGVDIPIGRNCPCHNYGKLSDTLYNLEIKIGIIKCVECPCYDKRP